MQDWLTGTPHYEKNWKSAPDVVDSLVVICNSKGKRVASGFILLKKFEKPNSGQHLAHAYLVTAAHCAFDEEWNGRSLIAQAPWMDHSMSSIELPGAKWLSLNHESLPDGESICDLAIQKIIGPNMYSGIIMGRATAAIDIDEAIDVLPPDRSQWTATGRETVTVGLFQFHTGDAAEIEPFLHFGHISMVPKGPISGGSYNRPMRAVLVESSASRGMSGAPVFIETKSQKAAFIGVHVGHQNEPTRIRNLNPLADDRADMNAYFHAGVSNVAPAVRLENLLNLPELVIERVATEQLAKNMPWRFNSRIVREECGVVLPRRRFSNMEEFVENEDQRAKYIVLSWIEEFWYSDHKFDEGPANWWFEDDCSMPIGTVSATKLLLGKIFGKISWQREEDLELLGIGAINGGTNYSIYLHHKNNMCLALELEFTDPKYTEIGRILVEKLIADIKYPVVIDWRNQHGAPWPFKEEDPIAQCLN